MSTQVSLVTEAARTAAAQNTADYTNSVAAHVAGDWGQHNQIAIYNQLFGTIALASGATYTSHTIPLSKCLRFLVTINDTNYAVIIPGVPNGSYSGGGTDSGAPGAQPPSFTVQPLSQVVTAGQTVSLSVTVIGTQPIFLQWRKNGISIGGATSATFTIANFQSGDAGNYDCVATNSVGQATSATATLALANSGGSSTPNRGGGGCLSRNTKITLANGSQQPITAINKGDQLRSFDIVGFNPDFEESWRQFNQAKLVMNPTVTTVREVLINTFSYYYLINGELEITYEHPVLVKHGTAWHFFRAQDLSLGDYLFKNGSAVLIRSIQRVNETIETWNFNVEPYDIFIANGYLVHNAVQKF